MSIQEILVTAAPLLAGFVTSILIPLLIKRYSVKSLQKTIDSVNEGEQLKHINEQLKELKREILEMRGKTK